MNHKTVEELESECGKTFDEMKACEPDTLEQVNLALIYDNLREMIARIYQAQEIMNYEDAMCILEEHQIEIIKP